MCELRSSVAVLPCITPGISFLQRQNYIDVATGSLGQGLSVSAGMAYCGKYIDKARWEEEAVVLYAWCALEVHSPHCVVFACMPSPQLSCVLHDGWWRVCWRQHLGSSCLCRLLQAGQPCGHYWCEQVSHKFVRLMYKAGLGKVVFVMLTCYQLPSMIQVFNTYRIYSNSSHTPNSSRM